MKYIYIILFFLVTASSAYAAVDFIEYNPFTNESLKGHLSNYETLALTGIANPTPLYEELIRRKVKFSIVKFLGNAYKCCC